MKPGSKAAFDTELRQAAARTEAILQSSLDAIVSMDHDGKIIEFNPAAERIFGYARADALGHLLADLIIPERLRDAHQAGLARYLATGEGPVVNRRIEMPALRSDRSEFPVELAIIPVAGSDPPVFTGFLRDISDRKNAEQRQQFLLNELAHRSKNLLAVIQAIVVRSLSEERPLPDIRRILSLRLAALARSQTLLLAGGIEGAALSEIIRLELEPFANRVEISGPSVALNAKASQTFALLIHELATNATKHGALARPEGTVSISWKIDGLDDSGRLHFCWSERGGPAVSGLQGRGFGRTLLETVVAQDFDTIPVMTFAVDGLVYVFESSLPLLTADNISGTWFAHF